MKPPFIGNFEAKTRMVKWCKLTGDEILEETEYPSQWIGIVPVIGHEIWIEGKRYLCGLVRRLRDGQKLHNYEMSALTEALMAQPKAPFLVSGRAIDGYEEDWARLNSGNPSHLPYNDIDENGQPIASPIRLSPPNFPVAYANTANLAVLEMEAAVGMPKPVFGMQGNAVSGRAKLADQTAGETATFHFQDNRRVAQTQVYKIVVDMLPRIYDETRQAKIMGEDGEQSTVMINPNIPGPVQREGKKVVAINLGVGRYDVRVKVGPSYTTLREEMGVRLQELGKGNPVLASALTPILMKLGDMPEADKVARIAMAMLPPEVQQAYQDEDTDIPPAVKSQMQMHGQQIQQMAQAMEQASGLIQELHKKLEEKNDTVKAEASSAIKEIQLAQEKLKNQADSISTEKQLLAKDKQIAQLQLKLDLEDAMKTVQSEKEAEKEVEKEEKDESSGEEIRLLAEAISQGQEAMAKALAQNTQTLAQLQALTVDALEDMSDALSAPRDIKLQHDKSGRTIGAKSVIIMPEPNEMQ
jgi:hypothetical protein